MADRLHHPLDIGRVLADQVRGQHPDRGYEIRLGPFDLTKAIDALVGNDAHNGMVADDGAFQVRDFHVRVLS